MPRYNQISIRSSQSVHPYNQAQSSSPHSSENIDPSGVSLTPLCDQDNELAAASSLTAKKKLLDAILKSIALDLAPPRPQVAPHHKNHEVFLFVDQGQKDPMNISRWVARVSILY